MTVDLRTIEFCVSLSAFSELVRLIEPHLAAAKRKELETNRASFDLNDDDQKAECEAEEAAISDAYAESVMPLFRKGLVVALCSFLEVQLMQLCEEIAEERKLPRPSSDSSGWAKKTRIYLKMAASVEVSSDFWDKISELQTVRNCLVHRDGMIVPKDPKKVQEGKQLWALAKKATGIRLAEPHCTWVKYEKIKMPSDSRLIVEKEFCENTINTIRQLFSEIHQKLGWRVHR